jgi:hypothetical protein
MIEVHAANRPGRPVLLLVMVSLTLAGVLGLAWGQSQWRRALAPPVRIPDTPLTVSPPPGWRSPPGEPGVFERVVALQRLPWQQTLAVERRLRFGYVRLPYWLPPAEALSRIGVLGPGANAEIHAARVGPFQGIEVQVASRQIINGRIVDIVRLIRAATLPRGDLIYIDYRPSGTLTLGDLTLLGDVAKALRFEDDRANVDATTAARAAHVVFEADRNWQFALARRVESPGFSIGPRNGEGWAITVHRTFLAPGRTPDSLLRDSICDVARGDEAPAFTSSATQRDNTWELLYAEPGHAWGCVGAWLRVEDTEATLVHAFGSTQKPAAARDAATRFLAKLRHDGPPLFPGVAAAMHRGLARVESLTTERLMEVWGQRPRLTEYNIFGLGATYRFEQIRRWVLDRRRPPVIEAQWTRSLLDKVDASMSSRTTVDASWFDTELRFGVDRPLAIREYGRSGEVRRERNGVVRTFEAPPGYLPPALFDGVKRLMAAAAEPEVFATPVLLGQSYGWVWVQPDTSGAMPAVRVLADHSPAVELTRYDKRDGEPVEELTEMYRLVRAGRMP